MLTRKIWASLAGLIVLSMIVSACSTPTPQVVQVEVTRAVVQTQVVKETQVIKETQVVEITPTPELVDRTGPWVDTVVVVEEPNPDAGVSRLKAGDIDLFGFTISSPATVKTINESSELQAARSYGSMNDLTFNPSVCADTARLNPFSVPAIREAMNWLMDRDYIAQEIMGGLATPKYVPVGGASADRARFAAEIRAIEAKYAYNPDKAREVISAEMEKLGATLQDGKWTYGGAPVDLIVLIRTEDERRQIGDYTANQLESLGFTTTRDYKPAADASPIWQRSDPTLCLFNVYTGGWVSTSISRDDGGNFSFYYTPSGLPRPLWLAYTPTDEFVALADKLRNNDFQTLEERAQLFAEALPLSVQDSVRVWLVDRVSAFAYRGDISVAADLSGSVYGTRLWAYTLRRKGQEGGAVTYAMQSILTDAWNPIGGSNWVYDQSLQRATGNIGTIPDPNTGLTWPQRVERAEITAQEGLPVGKTLDWLTLDFAPTIEVPADAWVDWDAASQTFITAGSGQTALFKSVVYYPADLYDTIRWHDGSPFSAADVVMYIILNIFDQAKPESPYYDEAAVPALETFMAGFKGLRITSTDPLVIEFYTDNWQLDAESIFSPIQTVTADLWPYYTYGEGAWHTLALGLMAEEKGLSAFTAAKSTASEVEYLSYIAGPSLEILKTQLDDALASGFIPYAPTLSKYITPDEAAARYANLAEFYRRRGHYWVGTGPFFLQRAFPVEGTLILERNPDFPDKADKWARFSAAPIPVAEIDGPGRVTINQEAVYDIAITFQDAPYAMADITQVKYLVFDAKGELAASGEAAAVADGQWQVTLGADITGKLEAGSNRLEVVAVSRLVTLAGMASLEFVTAP